MKRYLALSLLTLAAAGCDAMTAHTDTVARAGEHQLTVDETVDLVADNPQIPPRAEVIEQIADLWLNYTILASLMAEDSTLANFDTEPLIRPYVEQQTFAQLRDQVVTTDTVISNEELAELYAEQGPGTRVQARHILLSFPDSATEAQRDSVHALADELRDRAVAGEDFSELARQYSEDQGTASQGGDLGWFPRGQMVQPFEEAAFSLDVGEVSDVVESPFGLHIIKVDDRETRSLEETGQEQFRTQMVNQRRQASLNEYIESIRAGQSLEVEEGAVDVATELASDPSSLEGRAESRELVTWDGGALTAGEVADVFQGMPPQQRAQFTALGEERMNQLLRDVATNELVLADAAERGITVPEAEQDSVRELIRTQVARMATNSGLTGTTQEGETQAQAVDRRVRTLLSANLSGQANVLQIGSLAPALREQRDWQINDPAIDRVVERLEQVRSEASQPQDTAAPAPAGESPAPTGESTTPEPADTAG